MPSCFQLFPKNSTEAVSLNKLDEDICTEVLNLPVHPKDYGAGKYNWFDDIGYKIATKSSHYLGSYALRRYYLKQIVLAKQNNDYSWLRYNLWMYKILMYLEENYTSRSFYQVK